MVESRVAPDVIRMPDGRRLAFDDTGQDTGRGDVPVLYLHGTPDCRLARHPDDGLAGAAGTRLVAVDRPGAGGSDPAVPCGGTLGADLAHLLDHLGIERCALLGWSSGGLAALRAAATLGGRAAGVVVVGTLPPVDAYRDPAVLGATGPRRRSFMELATELLAGGVRPEEVAAEVAPHLVPEPLDPATAVEVVLETAGPSGRAELAEVPGAVEQLARGLLGAIEQGQAGLASLVAEQLLAGPEPDQLTTPVALWHGEHDDVSPPAVGEWLHARLPASELRVVPAAGHHLLLTRWPELLTAAAAMYRSAGGRC